MKRELTGETETERTKGSVSQQQAPVDSRPKRL